MNKNNWLFKQLTVKNKQIKQDVNINVEYGSCKNNDNLTNEATLVFENFAKLLKSKIEKFNEITNGLYDQTTHSYENTTDVISFIDNVLSSKILVKAFKRVNRFNKLNDENFVVLVVGLTESFCVADNSLFIPYSIDGKYDEIYNFLLELALTKRRKRLIDRAMSCSAIEDEEDIEHFKI